MSLALHDVAPPAQEDGLETALNPRAAAPHLVAVIPDLPSRACRIVDVRHEPGVRCSILYELGDRLVLGMLDRQPHPSDEEGGEWIEALGMRVYPFPIDPGIAVLAEALEPGVMRSVLAETLPECLSGEARVVSARVQLLRYRPGRRCTVRIDARLRARGTGAVSSRKLFGKIYHDVAKAESVFDEMRALHGDPALEASGCHVAAPVAFVARLALVLQEPLPGAPLDALLRGGGAASDVGRAAEALATLHRAPLVTSRMRPVKAAIERLAARARAVEVVAPATGAPMKEVVGELLESLTCLEGWGQQLGLVHGDSKPSQFLAGTTGIAILDFDHCGIADPASDVGNFIATLRQLSVRHQLKARAVRTSPHRAARLRALEQTFLDAYASAAGGRGASPGGDRSEGLPQRASWYQAAALVRKAQRSFQRSIRSPLPGALVAEAAVCLTSVLGPNSTWDAR